VVSNQKLQQAIDAARIYAARWGIPWGTVSRTTTERASWWPLSAVTWHTFTVDTGNGTLEVSVWCPDQTVSRFEFYPHDAKGWMLPLWAAFPEYTSVSIGWRMSYGEEYKYRWHAWYRSLLPSDRSEYKKRFPPPEDKGLGWGGFYEDIADKPSGGSIADHVVGRVP
jgi:hypothetical protein